MGGACGGVTSEFSPAALSIFGGSATRLDLDAGWGELLVYLHEGSRLSTPSRLRSESAAGVWLPWNLGAQVKVLAGWSVLCLRTDLPGCGALGPVDIDLGGPDPLDLEAPLGILVISDDRLPEGLSFDEGCKVVHLPELVSGLARAAHLEPPVELTCLDGMDLRCQEALYRAAFEFAERPWPVGAKGR